MLHACSAVDVQKIVGNILIGNFKKLDPTNFVELDKVQVDLGGITTDSSTKNSSSCTAILSFSRDGKKLEDISSLGDAQQQAMESMAAGMGIGNQIQIKNFIQKEHKINYKASRTDDGNLLIQTTHVTE